MNIENKALSPLTHFVYDLKNTPEGSQETQLDSFHDAIIFLKKQSILDSDLKISKTIIDKLPSFKINLRQYPQIIQELNQLINQSRTASVVIDEYDIHKPISYSFSYSIAGLCKAIFSKFKDTQIKIVFDGSAAHKILQPLYCHNTNRFLTHFGIPYSVKADDRQSSSDIDLKFYITNAQPADLYKFDQCILNFIFESIFPRGLPGNDKELFQGALRSKFYRFNEIFWNQNDWIGSFRFHDLDISVSSPRSHHTFLIGKDRLAISVHHCTLNTLSDRFEMYFSLDNQGTEEESWQSSLDQSLRLLHVDVEKVNSKCLPRIKSLESLGCIQPSKVVEEQLVKKPLLAHETYAKLVIDEFHHHGKNCLELFAMLMINTLYTLSAYNRLADEDFISLSNYFKEAMQAKLPIIKEVLLQFSQLADKQKICPLIIQKHFALFYLISYSGCFKNCGLSIDEEFSYIKISDYYFFHHLDVENSLKILEQDENSQSLIEFIDALFKIILHQQTIHLEISKVKAILALLSEMNSQVGQHLFLLFLTLFYRLYPEKIDLYTYSKSLYRSINFMREGGGEWMDSIHQIFHTKGLKLDLNQIIPLSNEQRQLYLGLSYFKTKDSTLKELILGEWMRNGYPIDEFLFYLKEIPNEAVACLKKIPKNDTKKNTALFFLLLKEKIASKQVFESYLSWCENFLFSEELDEQLSELNTLASFFSKVLVVSSAERFNSFFGRLRLDLQQKVWHRLSGKDPQFSHSQQLILLKKGRDLFRKCPADPLIGKGFVKLLISLDRKSQLEILHQFEIDFLKMLSLLALEYQNRENDQDWLSIAVKGLILAKDSFEHKKSSRNIKTYNKINGQSPKEFEECFEDLFNQIISALKTPASIIREDFLLLKQFFPKTFVSGIQAKIIVLGWCYDSFNLSNFSADFYAMIAKSPSWDVPTIIDDAAACLPSIKDITWLVDLFDRFAWLENLKIDQQEAIHLIVSFFKASSLHQHQDFFLKVLKKFDFFAKQADDLVSSTVADALFNILKLRLEKSSRPLNEEEVKTFLSIFQKIQDQLEEENLESFKELFKQILPHSILLADVRTLDYVVHQCVKYQFSGNSKILDQLINQCIDKNIPFSLIEPYIGLFTEKQLKKALGECLFNLKADKWSLWSCKLDEFSHASKEKIFRASAQIFLKNCKMTEKVSCFRKNLSIIFNHYLNYHSLNSLRFISQSFLLNEVCNCEPVLKSLIQYCRNHLLNQAEQRLLLELMQTILKKIENEGLSEDIHDALSHEYISKNLPVLLIEQLKFLSCNSFQQLTFLLDQGEFNALMKGEIRDLVPYMNHALYLLIEEFSKNNNGVKEVLVNKLLNILYFFVFSHPICRDVESQKKADRYRENLCSLMEVCHSQSSLAEKLMQEKKLDESIFAIDQNAYERYVPAYELFLEKLHDLIETHPALIENFPMRLVLRSFLLRNYKNLLNCCVSLSKDQVIRVCGLLLQCDLANLEETKQIYSNFLLPLWQAAQEKKCEAGEAYTLLLDIKEFLLFFYKIENKISFTEEQLFKIYTFYLNANKHSLKEYSYGIDLLLRLENQDPYKETESLYRLHQLFISSFQPSFHLFVYAEKKKIPFLAQKMKILLEKPFSPYYVRIQSLHFENYFAIWNFPSDEKLLKKIINFYEQLSTYNTIVSIKRSEVALGVEFIIRTFLLFSKSHSYQNGYYPYFIRHLKGFLEKLRPVLAQSKIIKDNLQKKLLTIINPMKLSKEEKKRYAADRHELEKFFK